MSDNVTQLHDRCRPRLRPERGLFADPIWVLTCTGPCRNLPDVGDVDAAGRVTLGIWLRKSVAQVEAPQVRAAHLAWVASELEQVTR